VSISAEETVGVTGTNYCGLVVRKAARNPTVLFMFLYLSVVSILVDCINEPFQTKPVSLFN
jgi:hypothetical protein